MEIKRAGSQPSGKGPTEWFTGTVRIDPLFQATEPARAAGNRVTFEPGARTAWHTHPLGQTLIVTSGCGWAQRWGGPIEEIRPGTVEADPESQARLEAFEQGLHALGWTVGRNVHIDYRFGSADPALTQKYAAELVRGRSPPNLVDSPIRRRCTPTLFPAILGLHLDKRATLVKDVSVLSSSWGAMKHEASRACSHYRLSNVISGWRCRATI
jgi:hypothetical protein